MIVLEKPPLDEALLIHYGIKGMKWGVRKESDEARAYRKTAQANFRKEVHKALDKRVRSGYGKRNTMTKEEYDKLGTKDRVFKKGHTVHRVSKSTDLNAPVTYVSTNKKDATIYRGLLPAQKFLGDRRKKYEGNYEMTLKATKDLVSPSEKARVDAFIQLLDTKSIKLRSGRMISGRQFLKKAGFSKEVRRMDSFTLGLEFYESFTLSQGHAKSPLNTAYFNALREKGYNALMDDNDRSVVSKDPLIVFDPQGNLKNFKVKQLTTKDVLDAQLNMKLPD